MSTFKKKFVEARNLRKLAEGEDAERQAFLDALSSIGYTVVPDVLQNGKPIITPYVLIANNQNALAEISGSADKDSAIQVVNNELQKLDSTLQPWKSKFYGGLSSAAYNKLQMKMRAANGTGQPRMSPQEQIAKIILDGALALEGNKVISASLEQEEVSHSEFTQFINKIKDIGTAIDNGTATEEQIDYVKIIDKLLREGLG